MSANPVDHSDEPELDEVEAALSHLETTLEGRSTDKILVCIRFSSGHNHANGIHFPTLH